VAEAPRPTRRDALRLGLGLAALGTTPLTGCTLSNPTVDEPARTPSATPTGPTASPTAAPASTPTPPPTPQPTVTEPDASGGLAQGLASLAARIAASHQGRALTGPQRTLLTFLVDAHQAHAEARGLAGPVPPGAKLETMSLRRSLVLLARRESAAARRHQQDTLASSGLDALVLGSMSVAATTFASVVTDADPPPVRAVRARTPMPLITDVAAVQQLVAQLHAMIYGYQLAIGRLPVLSRQHARAVRELRAHRILRDRNIAWLNRRKAEVPVAEPAYVPTTVPRSAATSATLIRQMQTAFQPFCGLWLAAAGDADRQSALTQLATTTNLARSWGAPLQAWPGF
jgi:hypothetical protein